MKIAMIDVHKELKKRNMKSRMILQVHDELLIEAECSEVDEVKELLICIPGKIGMRQNRRFVGKQYKG